MKKTVVNKKIKIVVTGGAGFIGSHLVDALVNKGFNVQAIDNLSTGRREQVNKKAKLHVLDVINLKSIEPVFKNAKYVFHLAALPSVQYSLEQPQITNEVNVGGTVNVLAAAQKAKVKKVIYSSSSAVYGSQKIKRLKESALILPVSPYGLQKYLGELYCRLWSELYGLPTVALRYFNVYGPHQSDKGAYASVIAKFLKQLSQNQPLTITGDGRQTRDFVNVKDIVRANILAMNSRRVGRGEAINIGGGNSYSVARIAQVIGGTVVHIPPRLEPKHSLADITLARQLLNWRPTIALTEGIEELKYEIQ